MFTRISVIVPAALLVVGGLLGCGGREQENRNRLVQPTLSAPKSFNPITSGETTTTDYTSLMYLGLTDTDPWTYQPRPELATSWTPDETGLVWTVTLREDVLWSDGEPFTADDVVFTYETIYNDEKVQTSSMRDIITGPNGEQWQVEAVDDYTVRFTLYDVNAVFPLLLAQEIIPEHAYRSLVDDGIFDEALGVNTPPDQMVGTGPFMLGEYDQQNRQVIMRRNPNYYRQDEQGNQLPYLDEIVFVITPSIDAQLLQFQQGELDIYGARGQDFPILNPRQQQDDFTLYQLGPANGSQMIFFNQNTGRNDQGQPYVEPHKLAWFRDRRFRQAVSHAIDRRHLVEGVHNGLGYPQYGPMNRNNPNLPFVNTEIPRFEHDLDAARALLAEMGLIDRDGDGWLEDAEGHVVEFNLTTNTGNSIREQTAETIRKDLETLGMRVNYRPMEFNTLISKLDSTYDWEACIMGLTGGPEPHNGANVWLSSGRMHMWFPRQDSPSTEWEAEIDELFARGVRELDFDRRKEIYDRWQEIVGREQPFIYTSAGERLVAIRNRFGNIDPAPFGTLHNIDEIYVLEGK